MFYSTKGLAAIKHFELTILSNNPPGGRCTLYSRFAKELSITFGIPVKTVFPGNNQEPGAPGLLIGVNQVIPVDGGTISPNDILNAIKQMGLTVVDMEHLRYRLECLVEETKESI